MSEYEMPSISPDDEVVRTFLTGASEAERKKWEFEGCIEADTTLCDSREVFSGNASQMVVARVAALETA